MRANEHAPIRNGLERDSHDGCDICRYQRRRDGGETLPDRLERLRPYWSSTRFALTWDDVRHDYISGRHRYA